MGTEATTSRTPSIALCMIVRDEAPIIERCISSALELIDHWVICDTGSTDGTPDLIERVLSDVPGRLHRTKWRNFGENRTELMERARGSADYLLLLDADMTLRIDGPLPRLDCDAYLIRHDESIGYAVPRLVRGNRRWWFEGPTHEYLATEGPFVQELLDELVVVHHADGSSREVKLERDRNLLEKHLRRHPDDPRTLFYLAQTYRDLGDAERATELYRRRADAGGWDEEVFYARFQQGCLLAEEDWPASIPVLLDAWRIRPTRAEPLYELAHRFRERNEHHPGHMLASRGLEISYPSEDVLFVHHWIYEWALEFEYSITAYGVGDHSAALAACERLLTRNLPYHYAQHVRMNRDHCLRALGRTATIPSPDAFAGQLPLLDALAPSARFGEIRLDVAPQWPATNPSIAAVGAGFEMIVRTVNYELLDDGYYSFSDEDGVIRTMNYLVSMDGDLSVRSIQPLNEVAGAPHRDVSLVHGYEDCRLFRTSSGLMATATVRDHSPEALCQVVLLSLGEGRIENLGLLNSPVPGRHEKNWMPFVVDDDLHLLYTCDPTLVYRVMPDRTLKQVSARDGPRDGWRLRGGSQAAPLDDGLLFVVHEVDDSSSSRVYAHRLVLMTTDFEIAAVSAPFSFFGNRIEFCAGIAPRGEGFVITLGVADRRAVLGVVDAADVRRLLTDV